MGLLGSIITSTLKRGLRHEYCIGRFGNVDEAAVGRRHDDISSWNLVITLDTHIRYLRLDSHIDKVTRQGVVSSDCGTVAGALLSSAGTAAAADLRQAPTLIVSASLSRLASSDRL